MRNPSQPIGMNTFPISRRMLRDRERRARPLPVNDDDIFDKTASGRDEIRSRSGQISQRTRSVLIMVDGVRTVRDLRQAIEKLTAPADSLESLLALELIVQTRSGAAPRMPPQPAAPPVGGGPMAAGANDAERFRVAKKFMNDTVVDALGLRSFMFTLKLEKCATLADLAALAPEYSRLLTKARGAEVSGALNTRLRSLLV
jgi:hypothetical protein